MMPPISFSQAFAQHFPDPYNHDDASCPGCKKLYRQMPRIFEECFKERISPGTTDSIRKLIGKVQFKADLSLNEFIIAMVYLDRVVSKSDEKIDDSHLIAALFLAGACYNDVSYCFQDWARLWRPEAEESCSRLRESRRFILQQLDYRCTVEPADWKKKYEQLLERDDGIQVEVGKVQETLASTAGVEGKIDKLFREYLRDNVSIFNFKCSHQFSITKRIKDSQLRRGSNPINHQPIDFAIAFIFLQRIPERIDKKIIFFVVLNLLDQAAKLYGDRPITASFDSSNAEFYGDDNLHVFLEGLPERDYAPFINYAKTFIADQLSYNREITFEELQAVVEDILTC
ncbi:MAG: hypothetical protein ACQEP8_01940 [Chlamydiota bacterium]